MRLCPGLIVTSPTPVPTSGASPTFHSSHSPLDCSSQLVPSPARGCERIQSLRLPDISYWLVLVFLLAVWFPLTGIAWEVNTRFPWHLGTGDYLSGLLGISCVCEGQGGSTLSARELCWVSGGLGLSHTAHHMCASVCLVRGL